MNTWIVSLSVKPAQVKEFVAASLKFADDVAQEAGLVSFAVLQQADDPGGFAVFEAYHDDEARAVHLASAHHRAWQAAIAPLLTRPPAAHPYHPIFPAPEDWEHHLEAG